MKVQIKVNFDKVQNSLDKLAKTSKEETKKVITEMVVDIQGDAKNNVPTGATGDLRNSINIDVKDTGKSIIGKVKVDSPYGLYVELGTGKAAMEYGGNPNRKMPPDEPIRYWVTRVIGITDEKELDRVVWLIRKKIKEEGTEGKFYLTKAFVENIAKFDDMVKKAIDRAIKKSSVK